MEKTYSGFRAGRRMLAVVAVLALAMFSSSTLQAQAPVWQSVVGGINGTGPSSLSISTSAATDANGNVFVAGIFIGQLTLGTITLTGSGNADMFLAKWSPTSNTWVWATNGGGTGGVDVASLVVSGNAIYVVGTFTTGPNVRIAGNTLTGAGNADVYLAKYIDNGNSFTNGWVVTGGSVGNDNASHLAINGSSLYITGNYNSTTIMNIAGTVISGVGGTDVFVAKYTDAGNAVTNGWAISGGGMGNDYGTGLAVNGTSVYLTGYFRTDPSVQFAGTTLTGFGNDDMFLAKYIDNGNRVNNGWATSSGGAGDEHSSSIATNGNSVYVAAQTTSNTATIGSTTLTAIGGTDVLLAKYTDTGTSVANVWATIAGGTGDDLSGRIIVNGTNIYLTGDFTSARNARIAGTLLTGAGSFDGYLAKYIDNGSTVNGAWAVSGGGTGYDYALGIANYGPALYVTGYITAAAFFGPIPLSNSGNFGTVYLARLTDPLLPTRPATALAAEMTVFPTPATGRFTLRRPATAAAPAATLHNALGQLVRTIATPTAETVVDVRGLPAGIYTLRLVVESVSVARRVVLE